MSIFSPKFFDISSIFKHLLPDQPCMLCGSSGQHEGWCDACQHSLPTLPTLHCPVCALQTPNGLVCGHCLQHPPFFTDTVAAYRYAFPLDKLILALKFHQQFHLAKPLASQLIKHVKMKPDGLIPMPLHGERLQERGFNQSLLLAKELGKQLQLPVLPFACTRILNTSTQSTLPWKDREKNVRKAFRCNQSVKDRHIAIIDDVMTTGATANELAKSILEAGAAKVSVWVVARTQKNEY